MRFPGQVLVGALLLASLSAQGAGVSFGNGCGGQGGVPAELSVSPAFRPGYASTLQVANLPPNQLGMLLLGDSKSDWWGTPLPLGLQALGMPGCQLLVAPQGRLLFGTGTGTAAATFTVPLDPVLAARRLYMQAMFEQPGLNSAEVGISRGFDTRIAPLPTPASLVQSITQYGITFQFAQPVLAGQFVNGDWFVVGPAVLTGMSPPCVTVNSRVMNGAMINPDPSTRLHGYDKALYGPGNEAMYRDALNVALNLSAASPRTLQPNQSLIKVISNTNTAYLPQIETCSVLTVLASIPPVGSFRPAYAGTDHTVRYDDQMLDLTRLQALPPAAGMPTFASQLPKLARTWLDHTPGWTSRYMHPVLNMPDYGRDMATLFNESALMCNTNAPLAARKQLATLLVQIGIDCYGNISNGCRWEGTGGHGSGRKLPILFAGALLGDANMLAVGQNYVSQRFLNGTSTAYFGEDCQTFTVQQTAPNVINWGFGGYVATDVGLAEFGFAHVDWPNNDTVSWTANSYRLCCTANGWIGAVLCARMMNLRTAWNHQVLFDYTDRYVQVETSGWTKSWSSWVGGMWDQYRPQF